MTIETIIITGVGAIVTIITGLLVWAIKSATINMINAVVTMKSLSIEVNHLKQEMQRFAFFEKDLHAAHEKIRKLEGRAAYD